MTQRNIAALTSLAVIVAISTIAPSFAATSGDTEPLKPAIAIDMPDGVTTITQDKIKGLVEVKKRGKFHSTFIYETEGGRRIDVTSKIKGVPDLRPEEVAHPYETKIHAMSKKWGNDANFFANMMAGLGYALVLLKR